MSNPGADELFPGGFQAPTSVFVSGVSRTLLKWFAFAALAPYDSRVYWTDVRLPGEILDPLDPIGVHAVREEAVYALSPRELQPDEHGARQAEVAATTMLRSDEPTHTLEGLIEFIRMPAHAQHLITRAGRLDLPPIMVTANAQRLAAVYSADRIAPLVRALLESGTCQFALWAEAPTTYASTFDVILHVDGMGPADWRNATVRCERGVTAGPLRAGRTVRLSEIEAIASVLEKSIPTTAWPK